MLRLGAQLRALAPAGPAGPVGARFNSVMSALRQNDSAYSKAKRLGRGPASGKGKTSGRGQKGQKARESVPVHFEGGQTPIHKMYPKFGFKNFNHLELVPINLSRLQEWINAGRIDASQPITMKTLLDSRLCRGIKQGVKILADGKERFTAKVDLTATGASAEAIRAIEAAGGTFTAKYYNRLGLRALLLPHRFSRLPLEADPVSQHDLDYYRNPAKRGYLTGAALPTLPNWPYKPHDADAAPPPASTDAPRHRWGFTDNEIVKKL
ncbi:mitochondrial 54S ribosomal protein uL15m, partial [Dipodascopsis tothii]|uniref:mitochondrial 54S ribosomal protein uL15m n=1 Tax=Dipodascopsis tothii TaxID=44089 RepID=UPI0034CD4298